MFLYTLSGNANKNDNPSFLYDGHELLSENAPDSEYTIMINAGYIGLDYSIARNSIVGISGVCPQSLFHKCSFNRLPFGIAQPGSVYLSDSMRPQLGQGCQLPYNLKPMLDPNGFLLFQNKQLMHKTLTHIACSDSLILSMYDESIAAVWVKLSNQIK